MKAFIASACLFALLICAITANCYFIDRACSELIELSDNLRFDSDELCKNGLDELQSVWDERKPFLRLSMNSSRLEDLEAYIISMKIYFAEGRRAEFESARALFSDGLADLRFFEELHF